MGDEYANFRRSSDVEDRRDEGFLAKAAARALPNYSLGDLIMMAKHPMTPVETLFNPLPERSQLGAALGLDDIRPMGSVADPSRYEMPQGPPG